MVENKITCNKIPLNHINTVFTYVPIEKLRGRCVIPRSEEKFKKELYKSIESKGVLEPLLVWFLTNVPVGPKSGFLVRVGSSRLQICKEFSNLNIKKLSCFVLNFVGTYKSTQRNKGFFEPIVEGELMNSPEKVLTHCYNKNVKLRFSEKGWLVSVIMGEFLKSKEMYK